MGFLVVFLGGGLGAALRHGVNLASARLLGTGFNYATLFENVTGSVVMGLLVGYFAFKGGVPQHWRLFLTTGILGGLWDKVRQRPEDFLDLRTVEKEGLDVASQDFIAGMTDRYAVRLFEKLFIPAPWVEHRA